MKGKDLEEAVRRALKQLGATRIRSASSQRADFLADLDGESYLVEVKRVFPFRAPDLRGRISEGVLELQKHTRGTASHPLVAIGVPRVTPRVLEEVRSFTEEFAPTTSWLVVDPAGSRGSKVGTVYEEKVDVRSESAEAPRERHVDPFSPRNQWALKVALLAGIDPRYFGRGREFKTPTTTQELGDASGLVWSQVWNLVAALRRLEYLASTPELRFRDCRRLLDDWAHATRLKPDAVLYAKPLYSSESRRDLYDRLAQTRTGERRHAVIVGSLEACRRLDLAKTSVERLRLYADAPHSSLLRQLDLVSAPMNESWVEIAGPKDFASVSSGSVLIDDVRVTDVIQCFVDVRHLPARGLEQADFLFERVLAPHFRSRGWG